MKTAREILDSSLIIDSHLDLPEDLWYKRKILGRRNVLVDDYLPCFKAGGVDVAVCAICNVGSKYRPEKSMAMGFSAIAAIYDELDHCDGKFVLVKNAEDILRAKEKGQVGLMLSLEGVDLLNGDVSLLRLVYDLGIRMVGLCWSAESWACNGSRFDYEPEFSYGLTEGGAKVVRYAQELGMILDVAHMNFQSFWDTAKITNGPIVCSHGNSFTIAPTFRNLKDDQIAEIAKRGGYVGITNVSVMTRYPEQENASLDNMGDHFLHAKNIGGTAVLAIGIDQFDNNSSKYDGSDNSEVFDVLNTTEKHAAQAYYRMEDFVDMLITKGFSEEEIRTILGGNIFRVIKQVLS